MEEPKSRNSENDVRPLPASLGQTLASEKQPAELPAREKYRFKIPAMVMKDELPAPSETTRLFDPVARSLRLHDKKVTGKHFACYNTVATRNLINGKWIVFIGGSVVRAMYRDLVHMVNNATSLVYPYDLARKGEISFEHDQLFYGHKLFNREPVNGIEYEEVRNFVPRYYDCRGMISFCFVTRFWNENLRRTLESEFFDPGQKFGYPDVVFANSCLWDLSRYGSYRTQEEMLSRYRDSVEEFVDRFKKLSNNKTLLVIMSTLPVSTNCSGAFLLDEHNSGLKTRLWKDIQKANEVCADVVKKNAEKGHYIVYLDLYTLVRNLDLSPWMEHDGTHWNPAAHRIFSFAVLSFISHTCYGSLLPAEGFEFYLKACDDLFRFNEYRRWLAMRILKKSNKTLEEVIQAAEERHSRQAGQFDNPPGRSDSRYHHANDHGGTAKSHLVPPFPSAIVPKPSHPNVPEPVTRTPKITFDDARLRRDLDKTATRFVKKPRLLEPIHTESRLRASQNRQNGTAGGAAAGQWGEANHHWNHGNVQLPRVHAEQWEEAVRHWNNSTIQLSDESMDLDGVELMATEFLQPVHPTGPPPPPGVFKQPLPPHLPQPPRPPKPANLPDFTADDYEMHTGSSQVVNDHLPGFVTPTGWLAYPNRSYESIPEPPGNRDYTAVRFRYQ